MLTKEKIQQKSGIYLLGLQLRRKRKEDNAHGSSKNQEFSNIWNGKQVKANSKAVNSLLNKLLQLRNHLLKS